jgi:hypothetical protein
MYSRLSGNSLSVACTVENNPEQRSTSRKLCTTVRFPRLRYNSGYLADRLRVENTRFTLVEREICKVKLGGPELVLSCLGVLKAENGRRNDIAIHLFSTANMLQKFGFHV